MFSLTSPQIVALFVNLVFLGSAFTIMLVYIWSRRNPYVRMNFFGLMNFQAPYLPWVLLGFSLLLGNSIIVDIMGKSMGNLNNLDSVIHKYFSSLQIIYPIKQADIMETSPYKSDPRFPPNIYSKNGGNLGSESK